MRGDSLVDGLRRESVTAFDAAFSAEHVARPAGETPGESGEPGAGSTAVLPAGVGLAETVLAVAEHGRVFLGNSDQMVDRAAFDSMLFRAWLFGILTFLETRARELIARDPDWRQLLSEARLEKARAIKEERARRGRAMQTVDALQFGDVGWLAVRYDGWYSHFGVASRKQAKRLVRQLESLRNALAHSQDIVTHDWDTVVAVARSIVAIRRAEASPRDV